MLVSQADIAPTARVRLPAYHPTINGEDYRSSKNSPDNFFNSQVPQVLCLSGNVESHAEVAVDAIKKNAKAPPAPAPAPQCLQWLAGNCMEWNGAPPGPPAPAPGPSGSSNSGSQSKSSYGGGGSSGSEGGSSSGGGYIPTPAHKVETGKAETHKYGATDLERYHRQTKLIFWRCMQIEGPLATVRAAPLNGACPMKDRMCNSLNKKKIAAIFEEQREEEAKKAEEEKKIKEKKLAKQRKVDIGLRGLEFKRRVYMEAAKKKEEQEKVDEEKAKARKKAVARAKAKGETPPPTDGSVYDTGCTPGKIGHE
eukprot:1392288-Amorphochlora_amoeboformis.AAC.1